MSAYDILTGIQLCMAMAMIAYGIYFRKSRIAACGGSQAPASWLPSGLRLYYIIIRNILF